jgi:hypothetical protein
MKMNLNNIIDIPDDTTNIVVESSKIYFGTNQDRTTDKLFGVLTAEENVKFLTTFFRVEDTKFAIVEVTSISESYLENQYQLYFELQTKVRFVEGHVHFYSENFQLYNRKHQAFTKISSTFMYDLLFYSRLYSISTDRCLLRTRDRLYLFWNEELTVLQSSDLLTIYPNTFFVDSILLENFDVNNDLIIKLSLLNSLEDAVACLKREMALNVL